MSKQKKKIGSKFNENRDTSEPTIIVFGTQRIGAIYALREGIDPRRIRLATGGTEVARGLSGSATVVRVTDEVWQPPTHACSRRTQETEQALKAFEQTGGTIETVFLA